MQPPRQKRWARILLATGALLGLAWLALLDRPNKISTDVLDLLPRDERSPEIALVRSLAGEQQARVALFALKFSAATSAASRDAATSAFTAALTASPAFAEVTRLDDTTARDTLGREVFARRLDLLFPGWLAARRADYDRTDRKTPWPTWLAERTATELQSFLSKPEALAFQELVPADPLLLIPALTERVSGFAGAGLAGGAPKDVTLIWARTSASPLREEGQKPVFAAITVATAAAQKLAPDTTRQWTAVSRFAAESRRRIEAEMSLLNLVSLIAVLGVAALCVRHLLKVLHLAPVILGAMLGAWVVTTAVFDRVHVLVFVVGSLLGGVAIDYGFYLYLQPPRYPGEPYRERVGRLLRPLLSSALTAILGFSLLFFSELPLIRQLGVFVSAGLLSALATALLWFAQVEEPTLATRAFIRARVSRPGPRLRTVARTFLLACAAIALLGPWRLRWHDDIRELDIPAVELRANDHAVRQLFGDDTERTVYLTRGRTIADARASLEKFIAWHVEKFPGTALASIGLATPSPAAWAALPAEVTQLANFEPALRAALAHHGFDADSFAPFFDTWNQWRTRPTVPSYNEVTSDLLRRLHGPLALLATASPESSWFATLAEHPPGTEPPAEFSTVSSGQLESLNGLFTRYRTSALHLSALGLGLVGLSVFLIYGLRRGIRIFAVPVGSCLLAFGLLGFAGATLNLFHLLGAFLGVCLSHNYAIFSAENAAQGEEPPPSIRLSALCTAASFGVLALSHIPVVAALGLTVAIIVLSALLIVELLPLAKVSLG
jgi:predicted exporter